MTMRLTVRNWHSNEWWTHFGRSFKSRQQGRQEAANAAAFRITQGNSRWIKLQKNSLVFFYRTFHCFTSRWTGALVAYWLYAISKKKRGPNLTPRCKLCSSTCSQPLSGVCIRQNLGIGNGVTLCNTRWLPEFRHNSDTSRALLFFRIPSSLYQSLNGRTAMVGFSFSATRRWYFHVLRPSLRHTQFHAQVEATLGMNLCNFFFFSGGDLFGMLQWECPASRWWFPYRAWSFFFFFFKIFLSHGSFPKPYFFVTLNLSISKL